MRIVRPASAGGGAAVNPNLRSEVVGVGTGAGTIVQAHATLHTLGTYVELTGAPGIAADCNGFTLIVTSSGVSSARFYVRLSLDNGATPWGQPVFVKPGADGVVELEIPMALPATTRIWAAISSSTSAAQLRIKLNVWDPQGAGQAPGFTIWDALIAPNTAGSQASAVNYTVVNDATTFADLVGSLAQDYGAFLLMLGATATPVNAGGHHVRLGAGAGHDVIGSRGVLMPTGSTQTSRLALLARCAVAAGQPISLNVQGATPGDVLQPLLHAFR